MSSDNVSSAVTPAENRWSDDTLRALENVNDINQLFSEGGIVAEDYSEAYGSGFTVLATNDKGQLCGRDLGLLEWRFSTGDNGEFVSVLAVTFDKDGGIADKFVINDGSTGIRDQLKKVTEARLANNATERQAHAGLRVKGGLRRSDYTYTDPTTNEDKRATTFYLAN